MNFILAYLGVGKFPKHLLVNMLSCASMPRYIYKIDRSLVKKIDVTIFPHKSIIVYTFR